MGPDFEKLASWYRRKRSTTDTFIKSTQPFARCIYGLVSAWAMWTALVVRRMRCGKSIEIGGDASETAGTMCMFTTDAERTKCPCTFSPWKQFKHSHSFTSSGRQLRQERRTSLVAATSFVAATRSLYVPRTPQTKPLLTRGIAQDRLQRHRHQGTR